MPWGPWQKGYSSFWLISSQVYQGWTFTFLDSIRFVTTSSKKWWFAYTNKKLKWERREWVGGGGVSMCSSVRQTYQIAANGRKALCLYYEAWHYSIWNKLNKEILLLTLGCIQCREVVKLCTWWLLTVFLSPIISITASSGDSYCWHNCSSWSCGDAKRFALVLWSSVSLKCRETVNVSRY